MIASNGGAGIEHWWTYEDRPIPGIGKAMVNVGTGNLLVSAVDVDIPERGIDLAFQRTYNSQSLHDYNGDDGGDPAVYGNLWTNNFDANIVYNASANTITVFDLDGTPCVYTSNGQGQWTPCAGEQATLAPTDSKDCTYAWTKPNGTVYWFNSDKTGSLLCSIVEAKAGRLQQIVGRNYNNNITFAYSYSGQAQIAEDITEITATHSDGQSLTLQFGTVPGTTINELASITRPDGAVLQYSYDTSGNLLEVDKPGNNAATLVPSGHGVPSGDLPETYAYQTGSAYLQAACGPRCTIATWNNPTSPVDGSSLLFTEDASARLTSWSVYGVLNFTPSDGTGKVLQTGPSTSSTTWYTADFVYGAATGKPCGATQVGTTTMCDTDGHSTIWSLDNATRVTGTQEWTGTAESQWLVTSQTWDASNDLTSTTDARGNTTRYGYWNGDMVEMQSPSVSDINGGAMRPLSYYSYDSNFNVTAYCDPVLNNNNGSAWVSPPTDALCRPNQHAAYFKYDNSDTNEPFGQLIHTYTPKGYHHQISYNQASQGGDYGLPTEVQGDQISQDDQSVRQPVQDFSYDGYGNLTSYDKGPGYGAGILDSWTIGYSSENQASIHTENDATINASGISSFTCYYPDGSVLYTESPSQHASDGNPSCPTTQRLLNGNFSAPASSLSYLYDADGDQTEAFSHKGCSAATPCPSTSSTTACAPGESNPIGTTCKYYDGLDRLVDVIEPYDSRSNHANEYYPFRWLTRYQYDLSQNGGSPSLSISDNTGTISNVVAYGNLYKTQECLGTQKIITSPPSSCNWYDVRGSSFDGLDRAISKYELAYGTTAVTTNTWDTAGNDGLVSKVQNAVGQVTTYGYDEIGKTESVTFSGTQPRADNRTYSYDPDGRTATAQNSLGTMSYSYDLDGNELSVREPAQEPAASLICYDVYPDGLREYVSVGPVALSACTGIVHNMNPSNGGIAQPKVFTYDYRNDGAVVTEAVNWSVAGSFTWTYAPSGRELTETDPLNKQPVTSEVQGGNITLGQKSYSYDSYGRVAALTLPETYKESTVVYDTDDELVGYNASFAGTSYTRQLNLDARGELVLDAMPGSPFGWSQGPTTYGNGTAVGDGNSSGGPNGVVQAPPTTLQYDVRSGMVMGSTDPQWAEGLLTGADLYTYDAAGRQVSRNYAAGGIGSQPGGNPTTTQYDAENHVETMKATTGATSATLQYGPDGRQRVDTLPNLDYPSSPPLVNTAHWDGDAMLFSNGASSSPNVLYVGKSAMLDSFGDWLVFDRDQTGSVQASHGESVSNLYPPQGTFYTSWSPASTRTLYHIKGGNPITFAPFYGSCGASLPDPPYSNQEGPCPSIGGPFSMSTPDGYAMADGIVQGVRTYDPTSGQWLTPDAYAGDVHDPISQKPFIWEGNNPINYTDPSGYDKVEIIYRRVWEGTTLAYHSYIRITTDPSPQHPRGVVTEYSGGPDPSGKRLIVTINDPNNGPPTHPDRGSFTVAQCVSTCTLSKDGFDEEATIHFLTDFPQGIGYGSPPGNGAVSPNSNTATDSGLDAGGASFPDDMPPNAPGWVPGWNDSLSPNNHADNSDSSTNNVAPLGPSEPGRFYDAQSGAPF